MFPAVSLRDEGTFEGASIIGKLPATPLLSPRAPVKKKDMASPEITGRSLGVQQRSRRGISKVLNPLIMVSCLLDQGYGIAAKIFPIMSVVLNVNMSSTGIQDRNLQLLISDSSPGYKDKVTQ